HVIHFQSINVDLFDRGGHRAVRRESVLRRDLRPGSSGRVGLATVGHVVERPFVFSARRGRWTLDLGPTHLHVYRRAIGGVDRDGATSNGAGDELVAFTHGDGINVNKIAWI